MRYKILIRLAPDTVSNAVNIKEDSTNWSVTLPVYAPIIKIINPEGMNMAKGQKSNREAKKPKKTPPPKPPAGSSSPFGKPKPAGK